MNEVTNNRMIMIIIRALLMIPFCQVIDTWRVLFLVTYSFELYFLILLSNAVINLCNSVCHCLPVCLCFAFFLLTKVHLHLSLCLCLRVYIYVFGQFSVLCRILRPYILCPCLSVTVFFPCLCMSLPHPLSLFTARTNTSRCSIDKTSIKDQY